MLKLKNITKTYILGQTKVPALGGVSLEFSQNEFVAVLGPSGCGKTTLLNIIGGLDRYTSGDLIINGRSTKKYKAADWDAYRNHSIGFVFQNYNLIPHLSVLHNVELALTLSGISKKERMQRAAAVLDRVGLSDQLNKKPSQLSGGQMQRVAIARALINDPEILLTDEPTGALDSQTSIQIMELIKEISGERLVIMVTHNPEIANKYSTRIINLLDGLVISDTKNHKTDTVKDKKAELREPLKKKKTAMSFFTALSLSFKNLFTKKVRTIITSVAGSIGIIGIALVLSLSNGFNRFIGKIQGETMANYPIIIEEHTTDFSMFIGFNRTKAKLRPDKEKVYPENMLKMLNSSSINNNISKEYIDYVGEINSSLTRGETFGYGIDYAKYFYTDYQISGFSSLDSFLKNLTSKYEMLQTLSQSGSMFNLQTLPNSNELVDEQYELIYGQMPKDIYDMLLIVDEYNRVSDISLLLLGALPENYDLNSDQALTVNFKDIIEKEYYLYTNDDLYAKDSENNKFNEISPEKEDGTPIRISGVIRIKEGAFMGAFNSGVAASQQLTQTILEKNSTSQIVEFMNEETTKNIDPFTGNIYPSSFAQVLYDRQLRQLGGNNLPNEIRIYPKDFKAKTQIKEYLDGYNQTVANEEDKITYVDNVELMLSTMSTMVDAISYVLIAFTAISLVVSSVMIGIITYVSVIERTKEIGILRSLGARKKDISRVFNAETFIIGLTAGLFGVIIGGILNIPINLLLKSLVEGTGNLALLNPLHALTLVLVSVTLTFIAGLIPSRIAAKKDPVVALRTE